MQPVRSLGSDPEIVIKQSIVGTQILMRRVAELLERAECSARVQGDEHMAAALSEIADLMARDAEGLRRLSLVADRSGRRENGSAARPDP